MGKNKAWGIWARGVLAIACSILPMTLLAQNPAPMTCAVSDFRRIALTVGNPTERVESAKAWLDQRGSLCNINQLNLIQSNLATWLGAALTGEITVMVEALQEQLLAKYRTLMSLTPHPPLPGGEEMGVRGRSETAAPAICCLYSCRFRISRSTTRLVMPRRRWQIR